VTLAGRIARAMALAAALAAVCTAALSDQLAWRLNLSREDARLVAAGEVLVSELGPAPSRVAAASGADDEDREMQPAGVRLALWRDSTPLGGAAGLSPGAPGCDAVVWQGASWRRCTAPRSVGLVVAASPLAPLHRARGAWLAASVCAALLAAGVAAVVARRVSSRALGPLARLRGRLRAVDADAPDADVLGPAEGYEEVDALRDALAGLLARHAESMGRSRRFAADAAHELRTPLTTMRAELELAAEAPEMTAEGAAALGRVGARLQQVVALSERLLILASPLEGPLGGPEAVSMRDVAADAIARQDGALRARLVLEGHDEALVRGDALLLGVVIDNLIDNALKFAPEGPVRVAVTASASAVWVRVADAGPGVPVAEQARVLEPFYRTSRSRAGGRRGHGVGLALVAHIVRAHGGAVGFEPVSQGAVVWVRLPPWTAASGG